MKNAINLLLAAVVGYVIYKLYQSIAPGLNKTAGAASSIASDLSSASGAIGDLFSGAQISLAAGEGAVSGFGSGADSAISAPFSLAESTGDSLGGWLVGGDNSIDGLGMAGASVAGLVGGDVNTVGGASGSW